MKEFFKKYYIYGLALFFIIGVGVVGELLYTLPIDKQADYQYLSDDQIEAQGFRKVEDGVYETIKLGGELKLSFDEQFVDKLYYRYSSPEQMNAEIYVDKVVKNGRIQEPTIRDNSNHVWQESTVNIHKKTGDISIYLPVHSGGGIVISHIAINNTVNYSTGRMLFYSLAAAFLLLVISILRGKIKWPAERIFLVVAVSVGALLLVALPSRKIGLDEEIHFGRAFYLFDTFAGKEQIEVSPVIEELTTPSIANWQDNIPQSEEEQKIDQEYWNESWQRAKANPDESKQGEPYSFQLYSFSYIHQALMIKAGQALNLNLTSIYMLGRIGNLIMYCGIVFLAIRHIKIGKRIMLILALMPTALFSAVTYSYDSFVIAFSFLGVAYLINELVEKDKKISYKNCVIFTISLILASFPKPIYIPMIALALFFPASKFRSKRERFIFKGIIGTAFLLMLASFMLPPILEPNRPGDSRGGDTNIGQQLRHIFARPFIYTQTLLDSIGRTFYGYVFGRAGLGEMGHTIVPPNGILITLLVGYTSLSDGIGEKGQQIEKRHKIAIVIISFIVMCLIWTALYLSFTPVGAANINGVQGRYYLPLTMMLLLAFNIESLRFSINKRLDYALISGVSIFLLMLTVYSAVITNIF